MSDELGGALTAQLGRLAATLRAEGVHVGVGDVLTGHRALAAVDASSRTDSYNALRAALCSRHSDLELFDAAFNACFGRPAGPTTDAELDLEVAGLVLPRVVVPGDSSQPAPEMTDPRPLPAAWSDMEILRHKDFADYTDSERELARRLMARLALRGPTRRSRRLRPSRLRGAHGAAATAGPAPHPAGVAALRRRADRAALARALAQAAPARARVRRVRLDGALRAHAAAVPARLRGGAPARGGVRIRHAAHARHRASWRSREHDAALARAWPPRPATGRAARASAAALAELNRTHGRRIGRGSVVVILSDGWDRGEPEELAAEMARLSRCAHGSSGSTR